MMKLEEVEKILRVRKIVSKENGNPAELQLVNELLKITADYKRLKAIQDNKEY